MTGTGWLHAIVSVLVPCVIGSTMYVVFGFWDRRRQVGRKEALPEIDYHI